MAWATRQKSVINPAKFGRSSRPKSRKNRGEQVSWLFNPGRRSGGGTMAAKKKRKSWSASHHKAGTKSKGNPARKHYSKKANRGGYRKRRNPAGFSMGQLVETGVFA